MNENHSFFQSSVFKGILYGIGIIIVLLLVFQLGVMVGYKRANFSYRWAENHPQHPGNFLPPPRGDFFRQMDNKDLVNGHGAFGEITRIDNGTLLVKGMDGIEKTVIVQNNTIIESAFDVLKSEDLKIGDHIIVIGSPDDSAQIKARIIRILPQQPYNTSYEQH